MTDDLVVRDHRHPGWLWLENAVLDTYGAQLGAYGIAVYVALCRHAGNDQQAYPSHKRLASVTGMSVRQARRAVDQLIALGIIHAEPRFDDGRQTSNTYTLLALAPLPVSPPPWPDRPPPLVYQATEEDSRNKTQRTKESTDPPLALRIVDGPAAPPPFSPYIAGVVGDYSREFGDSAHEAANIAQALRLWQASGLGEAEFVDLLHTTKAALRKAQSHGVSNKAAYYFRILRDRLTPARDPPREEVRSA